MSRAEGEKNVAESGEGRDEVDGLARVATISFVGARAAPSGGFWISLAGGVALARAGQRQGLRMGYGASLAAVVEALAIMGPMRFTVPLIHALAAPWLGRLDSRGARPIVGILICMAMRLAVNLAYTAFFIWVILGGLDAYAGTYNFVLQWIPFFRQGTAGALVLTGATLVGWAVFASIVQVYVYRHGLRVWKAPEDVVDRPTEVRKGAPIHRVFDPRAVACAASVAFAILLISTEWLFLAAVAAWLGMSWISGRPERDMLAQGLVLAAFLSIGALAFGIVGGTGIAIAGRRAVRALLLVLVAVWLRGAGGEEGLREVFSRTLGRLRRIPAVAEARSILAGMDAGRRLVGAGKALGRRLGSVDATPTAIVEAVVAWAAQESVGHAPVVRGPGPALAVRMRDAAMAALAFAPLAVLFAT